MTPEGSRENQGRGGSRVVRRGSTRPDSRVPPGSKPSTQQLRPLDEPRPVQVQTDESGAPVRVARVDSMSPPARPRAPKWYPVLAIRERWRIDDEWWRRTLSREYFDLVLEDGRVVVLYLDLVEAAWYAHGGGSAFAG